MSDQIKSFTVQMKDGTKVHYTADEPVSEDVLEDILNRIKKKYRIDNGQGEWRDDQNHTTLDEEE